MRLWTLHPRYLDSRGLVALWREGLLAQKVLSGATRGYRRHPQLHRFELQPDAGAAIASYLRAVAREAARRGYRFDETKIGPTEGDLELEASSGQLLFEWEHLLAKLRRRAPALAVEHATVVAPEAHPLFRVVEGPVADWERAPA
jgi:hypothetical protein